MCTPTGAPTSNTMRDQPTNLYRHFDADQTLLYVGISLSAIARLKQHKSVAGWRGKIATVTIETLPSRQAALDVVKLEVPDSSVETARPLIGFAPRLRRNVKAISV
jgi:hypothetical protein